MGLTMRVQRFPQTGETVLGTGYRTDFGGKGSNQAVGCARLGAEVHFLAKIGKDSFGEMALRLYRDEGIDISSILTTDRAATGVGFILVDESTGANCIALDPGANELLSADEVCQCAALDRAKVVLSQLEITVEAASAAFARARASGAVTILNPAPVRPLPSSLLQLVDILTPNETEARVLTGRTSGAVATPAELASDLIGLGVKHVIVTQGEKGALLVTASSSKHFHGIRVRAVDTTGAGDAFNAGLATALAFGASMEDAVQLGIVTGGLAVTQHGVIPSLPRRGDVIAAYSNAGLSVPAWMSA
jgi:ribokinase